MPTNKIHDMFDIPYSELKRNGRAYEIMLLRDQHENSFGDIAKEYELSTVRAAEIYKTIKAKQIHLYINHIAVALGHVSTLQVRNVLIAAGECYHDFTFACAYLEKKYSDILTEYRDGEPGMPAEFIRNMPPFRIKVSKKMIARVVEMRETEKASFVEIAKELHMTQAKARHTYEMFYHKLVFKLIDAKLKKAKTKEERRAIRDDLPTGNISYKRYYDLLTKE